MTRYAANTQVSPGRSRDEIERLLTRFGAEQFAYASQPDRAMIGFALKGRSYRIEIKIPAREEFARTETGKPRKESAAFQAWEQAVREKWRALALLVKAKLVAIQNGDVTLEDEFLAWTLLPDGRTVGQAIAEPIDEAYRTGGMPALIEFRG